MIRHAMPCCAFISVLIFFAHHDGFSAMVQRVEFREALVLNLSVFDDFSADRFGALLSSFSSPVTSMAMTPASTRSSLGEIHRGRLSNLQGELRFLLAVPTSATHSPAPLVVMLHGCKQDAKDFASGTRMIDLALREGYAVLLPEQSVRSNGSRCWNWFQKRHQRRGYGEPAFIVDLISAVRARVSIDPKRIYVAGLSAGAAMSVLLGHLYPEVFAAVGCHSGVAHGIAQSVPDAFAVMKKVSPFNSLSASRGLSRSPRPVIVFHGDSDATVHHENANLVVTQHHPTTTASRAVRITEGEQGGLSYTRTEHVDGSGACDVEQWRVHGGGHTWFGGDPSGSYTDSRGPNASAEMLRFFRSHRLA
jgi:poly(hydroxyalkanoate) depolymerase family esterase